MGYTYYSWANPPKLVVILIQSGLIDMICHFIFRNTTGYISVPLSRLLIFQEIKDLLHCGCLVTLLWVHSLTLSGLSYNAPRLIFTLYLSSSPLCACFCTLLIRLVCSPYHYHFHYFASFFLVLAIAHFHSLVLLPIQRSKLRCSLYLGLWCLGIKLLWYIYIYI